MNNVKDLSVAQLEIILDIKDKMKLWNLTHKDLRIKEPYKKYQEAYRKVGFDVS